MMRKKVWYAIYKGDKFICQGTKEECAKFLNVEPRTIYFLSTPANLKRRINSKKGDYLIAIKVPDED